MRCPRRKPPCSRPSRARAMVLRASAGLDITGPVRTVGHVDITAAGALTVADVIEALGADHDLKLQAASLDLAGALKAAARCAAAVPYGRLAGEGPAGGRPGRRAARGRPDAGPGRERCARCAAGRRWPAARRSGGRRPSLTLARAPEVTVRELVSGADMSLAFGRADLRKLSAGGALLMQGDSASVGTATVGANAQLQLTSGPGHRCADRRRQRRRHGGFAQRGRLGGGALVDVQARNAAIGTLSSGSDTTLRVIQGCRCRMPASDATSTSRQARRRWVASLFVVTPASAQVRWGLRRCRQAARWPLGRVRCRPARCKVVVALP